MRNETSTNDQAGSPPFITGGGGFEYEDGVAAYILAAMLAEQSPFGEEFGTIVRVDWQTGRSGWGFDDLLVTCQNSAERRIAISCKSGRCVTGGGWPMDAVNRAWEQWTRAEKNPFHKASDLLAVVTGSLAQEAKNAWDRLLTEALQGDSTRFMERYQSVGASGEAARNLVESLKCPTGLEALVSDELGQRFELIRHLRLWLLDVLALDSAVVTRAIEWCRSALVDGDRARAMELFQVLKATASERRTRGGTISKCELIGLLAARFALKSAPSHEASWRALDAHSTELQDDVRITVNDIVCFTQADAWSEVRKIARPGRVVFLEGESGSGKSSLAKRLGQHRSRTLWLSAVDLEHATLSAAGSQLGVTVSLTKLLDEEPSPNSMLVIDGAERLTETGRRAASRIVSAALKASQPWLVVITTQESGTDALALEIGKQTEETEPIQSVQVRFPDETTVREVLEPLGIRFSLRSLPSLLRALRNLKALDWLARASKTEDLKGFPDVVEQVWRGLVGTDDARARAEVLKKLGREDAARMVGGVPASTLSSVEEQRVAQGFIHDGLLSARRERLFFRHDLLGDWARLLVLIESGDSAPQVLRDVSGAIRWGPAIRLFAEWLLQEGTTEQGQLASLLVSAPLNAGSVTLLEGLFRSPECGPVIDAILSNQTWCTGATLVGLLRTFVSVATQPATICRMAARELQARIAESRHTHTDGAEHAFEAVLYSAPWLPEEVASLALELSARRPVPPAVRLRIDAERKRLSDAVKERLSNVTPEDLKRRQGGMSIGPTPRRRRARFTDGPTRRVSEEFRKAVFSAGVIARLAAIRPEAAQEVLLACCLEDPSQEDPRYSDHHFGGQTGTVDLMAWYPPLYLRGPWLGLLAQVPEQGLEAVMRLVAIGTSEWLRLQMPPPEDPGYDWATRVTTVALDVDGVRRVFRGDNLVFGWYRGHGRPGNIVASALMALESWLYGLVDAKQSIEWVVKRILETGTSVALLGVLAAVGRRNHEFLNGPLRGLISSWMLLDWDEDVTNQAGLPLFDPFGLRALNDVFDNEAERWSSLPHRRVSLPWLIAQNLVFDESAVVKACEAARAVWQAELSAGTCLSPETVQRLVALLDPKNLSLEEAPAGQRAVVVNWPPELAAKYEERRKKSDVGITAVELRQIGRRLLDNPRALTDEQAELMWKTASSLPEQTSACDDRSPATSTDARSATAAALENHASGWLDRFPERRSWCEAAALEAVRDRPHVASDVRGVSTFKEHGEGFAGAWAVARIAAGDTRDVVRRALAEAMTAPEYLVTGQVLAAAVRLGGKIPGELGRLFNLAWLWAALRNLTGGAWEEGSPEAKIAVNRRKRLVETYVSGQIPNAQIAWDELKLRAARMHERYDRRWRARRPSWSLAESAGQEALPPLPSKWDECHNHGFNWSVLEKVVEPLQFVVRPSLGPDLSPLIEFDRRLIDLAVWTMKRAPKRRHHDSDSLPSMLDRHTLGRAASIIAAHEDERAALGIWHALAPHLAQHHHWVEAFFDAWFRNDRKDPEHAKQFHKRWRMMIEHVASLSEWKEAQNGKWYDLLKARSALLGVHERGSKLGIAEDRPFLAKMVELYGGWAKECASDAWRLRSFCYFLQKPGAVDLRLPGLEWVCTALKSLADYRAMQKDLLAEVVGLCVAVWYQQSQAVLANAEARSALIALVQHLAQMQVQEIQELKSDVESAVAQIGVPKTLASEESSGAPPQP